MRLFLPCLVALAAGEAIRGVAPEKQHLYASKDGKWACLSDPSIVLLVEQINDDFCDCPDGSDEPGTNACPFTGDSPKYFYCENAGFKPAYIENYKLNDGVCDYDICCDGSDEYKSQKCPSKCEAVAEQLAKYVAETKEKLVSALDIKRGIVSGARHARQRVEQKVQESEKEAQNAERRMGDLAQELEKAKNSAENSGAESVAVSIARDVSNHLASLEQKARNLAEILQDRDRQIALLEGHLEDLHRNYNPNFNDLAVKRAVNSYADYMSNKETPEKVEVDAQDYKMDLMKKLKGVSLGEMVPSLGGLLTHYYSQFVAPKKAMFQGNEQSEKLTADIKNAQKDLEAAQAEASIYRDDLASQHYGKDDIFRGVQGQWINKKIGEYNYRIGFLDSVYQDNTLVGRFAGFDGESMQYRHGSKCWNGPQRSAKIDMVCGHTSELISVSEPEKCQYRFLISTPLVCEDMADEDIEGGFKVDLGMF